MQTQEPDLSLFELLSHSIQELETIEDDPNTLTFVARRVGHIVKHVKDLREDLQPPPAAGTAHSCVAPRPAFDGGSGLKRCADSGPYPAIAFR